MMTTLPITLTIAAGAALLNLALAARISAIRFPGRLLLGDGGRADLLARMRAHANFAEYAPFVLILIGLIELAGGRPLWLWAIGGAFLVARLAHAHGMDRGTANPWRAAGALVTWLVLLALAGWALALVYSR